MVVRLKLFLFGPPRDELASTVDGDVPEWIDRLYESCGTSADSAPASGSVLALGESLGHRLRKLSLLLSKMEALGWSIKTGQHAPVDKDGKVRWSHGLLP